MISKIDKNKVHLKRHAHVCTKSLGIAEKPRLNMYRSNKYAYAQITDDAKGETLVQASSQNRDIASDSTSKVGLSTKIDEVIIEKASDKGIKKIVSDRGGYSYRGHVKALAEAAGEDGLEL